MLDRIMSFKKIIFTSKIIAEIWEKPIQFNLNCKSGPKRLNSVCKVLRRDFVLSVSICKRFCCHFLQVKEFWRPLLAKQKFGMMFSFWHLTKKLISIFAFLSLWSTFSKFWIAFKTFLLSLSRTIDEIDS